MASKLYESLAKARAQHWKNIQALALAAVLIDDFDPDYNIRLLQRWYSRTFYTPLTEVEQIPTEYLLQTYWESKYNEMEAPQLEEEKEKVLETPEEREAREREEAETDASDEEWIRKMEEEAEKSPTKVSDLPLPSELPALSLGNVDLPDIKMKFQGIEKMDPDAMNLLLEGFGSVPLPVNPRKPR